MSTDAVLLIGSTMIAQVQSCGIANAQWTYMGSPPHLQGCDNFNKAINSIDGLCKISQNPDLSLVLRIPVQSLNLSNRHDMLATGTNPATRQAGCGRLLFSAGLKLRIYSRTGFWIS